MQMFHEIKHIKHREQSWHVKAHEMMAVIAVDLITITAVVFKRIPRIAMPSFSKHFCENLPCVPRIWCSVLRMRLKGADPDLQTAFNQTWQYITKCLWQIAVQDLKKKEAWRGLRKGQEEPNLKRQTGGHQMNWEGRSFWVMAKHRTIKLSKGKCVWKASVWKVTWTLAWR